MTKAHAGPGGRPVPVRRALLRWVWATIVVAGATALAWLVSLALHTGPATAAVSIVYAVALIRADDRHWLSATLAATAVGLPLVDTRAGPGRVVVAGPAADARRVGCRVLLRVDALRPGDAAKILAEQGFAS